MELAAMEMVSRAVVRIGADSAQGTVALPEQKALSRRSTKSTRLYPWLRPKEMRPTFLQRSQTKSSPRRALEEGSGCST
jgi:hypothetical protein